MPSSIFLYPGFVTKGQKGRILWHPGLPSCDARENDWETNKAVDITNCIHDPWPFVAGGKSCCMEVGAPRGK